MEQLFGIPDHMTKWNTLLDLPYPSKFGEYILVDMQPASVEMHHEVWVLDENERPLRGISVIFGFGSGPDIARAKTSYWRGGPVVLKGNQQWTDYTGGVKHTFGEGGEDIFIYDVDPGGTLYFPSTIVKNCTWVKDRFTHTGVQLVFKRQDVNVVPVADQILDLENRLSVVEASLGLSV